MVTRVSGRASEFNVNDMVKRFFNRLAAAKNSGGIGLVDLAFGTIVPPDYWFDDVTLHWIPPKVRLL